MNTILYFQLSWWWWKALEYEFLQRSYSHIQRHKINIASSIHFKNVSLPKQHSMKTFNISKYYSIGSHSNTNKKLYLLKYVQMPSLVHPSFSLNWFKLNFWMDHKVIFLKSFDVDEYTLKTSHFLVFILLN